LKAACQWLALTAALAAAAKAGPPTPPTLPAPPATSSVGIPAPGVTAVLAAAAMAGPAAPPATSSAVVPSPGAAKPGTTPGATPDEEFIEFLGADDDAVRWDLTNSAQRKGQPPAVPQDATP